MSGPAPRPPTMLAAERLCYRRGHVRRLLDPTTKAWMRRTPAAPGVPVAGTQLSYTRSTVSHVSCSDILRQISVVLHSSPNTQFRRGAADILAVRTMKIKSLAVSSGDRG